MTSMKAYVLDTSVLLSSAGSIRSFSDNLVVIPYAVLEELDTFKTSEGSLGANSRQVARELNTLRTLGKISEEVPLSSGGTLKIEMGYAEPESAQLNLLKADDRIINVCLGLQRDGHNVVLVTRDVNLAIRADVLGVAAQDYEAGRVITSVYDLYSGTRTITTSSEIIDAFYSGEPTYAADLEEEMHPNEYATLVSDSDPSKTALAKKGKGEGPLTTVRGHHGAWGVKPRNREQVFACDALLDHRISLVTLTGPAGTGKTLMALACALQQVVEDHVYDRLIVSRPVQPMGRDIGFLPGTAMEKMDPWMGPLKDALEFLTRGKGKGSGRDTYAEMIDMGMIEVEPLTYIRGRSIPRAIFVLDEAQDMTKAEVKTVVSRMGEGSKLILIGDVMQISNPYLDATNSGLSTVVERFKEYGISAHVSLTKGERSELATIAGEIL